MTKDIVKKAKNGTYYFRANLGYHPITGKQIQKYRSGFKTKKEAREEYSRLLLTKSDALEEKQDDILFQHFIEDIFLPWYKTQVKGRTYDNRLPTVRKHFTFFNNLITTEITPIHVQKWQLALSKKKYRSSYIRNVQGLFSMAMDRAVVLGLAENNPSKIVGNVKKTKTKIDFWTKEEFEKVISLFYKEDYYQHFLFISLWFLFMTGMRIGEATAIQWEDIDFDKGLLSIDKTLYYKNLDNYSFVEPKTKASVRHIALDGDTLTLLREWKDVQQSVVQTNFVMSYNGVPTQKHTLANAITRFSQKAGVHRIRLHALRHSHASLLISMGENPLIIKDRLGHEDIETTLGTYGHLYPNSNFEVAHKLEGIMSYQTATENEDTSPKNQFTARYLRKGLKTNNAITMQ
ncbi:tyrosine-type recombinase/integrase [Globicatella sanguinis]|uniref:tyrosine-type recombinase/integrase n=1 Tax=Globicatella sanguinis TaxID=13076 RepID=UPI000C79643D|nr:tyrosine-type recombinase/integrase [Globicatella sanguinis]MDK7630774.1 tyrosine-type recombinase/integrase [Globicatella sanguinis]WIK67180.1 tyrosine-type recombinase/integrase [Globicatella sanguinis]WKT56585.1 tyrosine-type recombinase/integrase [Globicatella sanguinis]